MNSQSGESQPNIEITPDMLAVPHEVGHYVFWHGSDKGSGFHAFNYLRLTFSDHAPRVQLEKWSRRWTEEIFADVYGALVASSPIALDFQDLQLNRSREDFIRDDEDHPVPILRPYVYTQVFEKAGEGDLAQRLNQAWEERLRKERGFPEAFVGYKPSALCRFVSSISAFLGCSKPSLRLYDKNQLERAKRETEQIVNVVHDLLKDVNFASNWWRSANAQSAFAQSGNLEDVPRSGSIQAADPPGLEPGGVTPYSKMSYDDWQKQVLEEDRVVRPPQVRSFTPDALDWIAVLNAGGWTTEGPQGYWP